MEQPPGDRRDKTAAAAGGGMRARAEALTARGQRAITQLEGQRPRHAAVEVGFRWYLRDRAIAGGVLGGGLAYRLFFWALALSLLLVGGLGVAGGSSADVHSDGEAVGLSQAVAGSISTAAHESQSGRWWLIALGAYFSLWFSWSLLRSIRLVHAAAWQTTPMPIRNAFRGIVVVLAFPIVVLALVSAAGWVRAHTGPALGLVITLSVVFAFTGMWLSVSRALSGEPTIPWTAYLPGAVLFGVGVEVLQLVTVYYLADRLASASALYGTMGLAGTTLFFLYLIGRGVVWAAELNAVVWAVRSERASPPGLTPAPPADPPSAGDAPGGQRL